MTFTAVLYAAVSVAVLHTAVGVDHTLPFVALGKARRWSLRRTLAVTAVCGVGHVLSSVLIGVAVIGVGLTMERALVIEMQRGQVVAWLLVAFGFAYAWWALWRQRVHAHVHAHQDGTLHTHQHQHQSEHVHVHGDERRVTAWVLFVLFVLGPCETLVPLMLLPAAQHAWGHTAAVAALFGVATVATMLLLVSALWFGLSLARLRVSGRYAQVAAGLAVAATGALSLGLGL